MNSLLSQSYKDFEVIIVDNGSKDRSIEISEKHPLNPRIIRLGQNIGFAGAVNRGIVSAKAELVALLNNDAEAVENWLEQLVKNAEKNPGFAFFASLVLKAEDKDRIESAGVGWTVQARVKPIFENKLYAQENLTEMEVFLGSGTAVLFRRELVEKIGKFDEDYFAYLEDIDFFLRARIAGEKGMLVPSAIVYHFGAGTELGDLKGPSRMESASRVYLIARNRWYLIWEHLPLFLIFSLSPLIFFGWVRGLGYHLFYSRQIKSFLKGSWEGFFSFRKRRKKREAVNWVRKIGAQQLWFWMKRGYRYL